MPTNRGAFELTILGCSGGPISGKTCSFLLKPADVDYASIVAQDTRGALLVVDAGTGLTSIVDILDNSSSYLQSCFLLQLYPKNSHSTTDGPPAPRRGGACMSTRELIGTYVNTANLSISYPFKTLQAAAAAAAGPGKSSLQTADAILNSIDAYLITHSHLDHVASLVINSPAFSSPKAVYGLPDTVASIKNNLFNGLVWPDLVSMGILSLHPLTSGVHTSSVASRFLVTPFKLSHGTTADKQRYLSTAFLISDVQTHQSILFFGDVESDASAHCDFNSVVWKSVAPLIVNDSLNTVVIECSTVDKPPPLFGHLTPSNLVDELLHLRRLCVNLQYPEIAKQQLPHDHQIYIDAPSQPLEGLNLIIIHVKETLEDINPRYLILQTLNSLNTRFNLKINFTIALSGLSFVL